MPSTIFFGYEGDSFGFTKQTAIILEGLGIGDLIPKFKEKNISIQALPQLSKADFITLGVDADMANIIVNQLSSRANKDKLYAFNIAKSQQFIDIIKSGKQHLTYIQAIIAYTRLKLLQTPTDYIIDCNNNMRASEALCTVASSAIQEITNFKQNIKNFSTYIYKDKARKKQSNTRICIFVSGIGLSAYLIYRWTCIGH